jgi:hypothetical protein
MRCKAHVRFLIGEGVRATSPPYPTGVGVAFDRSAAMKAKILLVAATVAVMCLSLSSGGCGPGGGEAAGKITKEAASAAGKALRRWQQQNR